MPFTPSHAIVALPFVRTPLPWGAVAVGSMAPDVPLFFPLGPSYQQTHEFPSLLVVSVPVGLLLYLIWRRLLRPAMSTLLPRVVASRLPASWAAGTTGSARRLPWVVLAVALGVGSHVAWDLFTHHGRFGSTLIPALADQWGPIAGTQWLQYPSSVGGLAVLAVAAARHLRRTPALAPAPPSRIRTVFWVLVGASLVAGLVGAVLVHGLLPGSADTAKAATFVAGTLAGALILLLTAAASVVVLLVRRRAAGRVTTR